MKYFIDTEFLEGTQKEKFPISLFRKNTPPTIDLISIGIVSETGREYYAISKDFNLREAWDRFQMKETSPAKKYMGFFEEREYWIRYNILKPIFDELIKSDKHWTNKHITLGNWSFTYKNLKHLISKYGKTNKQIAKEVKMFIGTNETIGNWEEVKDKMNTQFYAYYADYDWVVFSWLFGKMMDLPTGFPMYCVDLKQIVDEKVTIKRNNTIKNYPHLNVAEWDTYLSGLTKDPNYPKQINEHNALADANWNKQLYEFLKKI